MLYCVVSTGKKQNLFYCVLSALGKNTLCCPVSTGQKQNLCCPVRTGQKQNLFCCVLSAQDKNTLCCHDSTGQKHPILSCQHRALTELALLCPVSTGQKQNLLYFAMSALDHKKRLLFFGLLQDRKVIGCTLDMNAVTFPQLASTQFQALDLKWVYMPPRNGCT